MKGFGGKMKKFVFVLLALLLLAIPVSAQSTGGAAQPTPEATTEDGLPIWMDVPGEDDGTCRHLNADDVESGFVATDWGGADGAYSHVRMSFRAPTFPVDHDVIWVEKDVHGSNLPGTARIVFAGELVELPQYGGHVFIYVFCRPDQILEFLLEFFGPYEEEHLREVITGLGLDPEDYLDRPNILVVPRTVGVTATPTPSNEQGAAQREAAVVAMQTLIPNKP
jgi:hypothetical protein